MLANARHFPITPPKNPLRTTKSPAPAASFAPVRSGTTLSAQTGLSQLNGCAKSAQNRVKRDAPGSIVLQVSLNRHARMAHVNR